MKTGVLVGPCSGGLRRHGKDVAGRPPQPNDPAAWGYAARSPAAGKIWRTTPPSRTDTSAARARFRGQIAPPIRLGRVEPFSFRPDKTLPGTLHHSGNRPAPPSDHIPLARRSAFQRALAREFGHARGVRTHTARRFCRPDARQFASRWKMGTLWFRFRCGHASRRIDRELTHATRRLTS
jgi:hypothetical protein